MRLPKAQRGKDYIMGWDDTSVLALLIEVGVIAFIALISLLAGLRK